MEPSSSERGILVIIGLTVVALGVTGYVTHRLARGGDVATPTQADAVDAATASILPHRVRPTTVPSVPRMEPVRLSPEQPVSETSESQTEIAERRTREYEQTLRDHDAEPIDPSFALRANRSLTHDLGSFAAANHFEVVGVDCRTTTCVASLRWPTYATAAGNWQELLHYSYETNCARQILLTPPTNPADTYTGRLILHCENLQAGR